MAFDMGFNFRGTSGYVTDPAYGVPVLGEAYPHTYTNGNGDSINAGFPVGQGTMLNRDSTNDPRIAGIFYWLHILEGGGGSDISFRVDLSSGSAPGAGDYAIDLALGDPNAGQKQVFEVLDNTTVLIDGTNGGAGYSTAADHYIDATLADVNATSTWIGATAAKTFASTTAYLKVYSISSLSSDTLAHFRLTLAGAVTNYVTSACIAVGVVTLTKLTSVYKTIALVSIGVTTLIKQISPGIKAITATGVAALSESYQTARSLSMTSVGTVALGLNISFLISVITIAIASLSLARIYTRAVSAVAIGVADLATLFSEASAVIFETGKVPIRVVGAWAIGVVRAWRTTAGIGVVPVHTVTDNVAGVVPVFLEVSPGIGIVPIDGG